MFWIWYFLCYHFFSDVFDFFLAYFSSLSDSWFAIFSIFLFLFSFYFYVYFWFYFLFLFIFSFSCHVPFFIMSIIDFLKFKIIYSCNVFCILWFLKNLFFIPSEISATVFVYFVLPMLFLLVSIFLCWVFYFLVSDCDMIEDITVKNFIWFCKFLC